MISDVDTFRTENRKLRATVKHLTDELKNASLSASSGEFVDQQDLR